MKKKVILDTNKPKNNGSTAVSEKISALLTEDYIKNRGKKGSPEKFKMILNKVKSRKPFPWDEI